MAQEPPIWAHAGSPTLPVVTSSADVENPILRFPTHDNADVVLLRHLLLDSANKSLAAVFQRVGLKIPPKTALFENDIDVTISKILWVLSLQYDCSGCLDVI